MMVCRCIALLLMVVVVVIVIVIACKLAGVGGKSVNIPLPSLEVMPCIPPVSAALFLVDIAWQS